MSEPQPRPFRLKILDRWTEIFESVNPTNGFHHDLRGKVFRGRATFGANDPIPMVTMLEDPRAGDLMHHEGFEVSAGDWVLLIQGFAEDDMLHPTDPAHFLADEVRAAARKQSAPSDRYNYLGLGEKKPCVTDIRVGSPVVRPPDEISTNAYFYFPIAMSLVEG